MMLFVAPSIIDTLLFEVFVTYTLLVTGFTATAKGSHPVATVVVLFVAPSITVTLLLPLFAT
jgi:hypothetical protein